MIVEKSEFKGRPVIHIKRDTEDKYGVSMGVSKCKLVVENLDAIKEFITENDNQPATAQ